MKTEDLKPGQMLLLSVAQGKSKLLVTFAQMIERADRSDNILALLNASDERFAASTPKAQYAFLTAEAVDFKRLFDFDIAAAMAATTETDPKGRPIVYVNKLNPTINGKQLMIQSVDQVWTNNEARANDAKKFAKQFTKGGEQLYMIKDGKFIFNEKTVVNIEPKHVIIASDATMTYEEAIASGVVVDYRPKKKEVVLVKEEAGKTGGEPKLKTAKN